MKTRLFRWLFNWYPPYIGAGVRVKHLSPDFRRIDVEMKLRWTNRNYVGTHFGGSLYSMTDPFYMIMLMKNLGPDYIVWDKSACITFVKPGKGTMSVRFELTEEQIQEAIEKTNDGSKYEPTWTVNVTDSQGDVVARVEKTLYVRRKKDR